MLPGTYNPQYFAGPPAVIQRATSTTSARATSTVLSWAAAAAGSLIVIEFCCETNAANPTTPAGYTLWASGNASNGGGITTSLYYKVAAAGETGVTITHGSNQTCSIMREFTNCPAGTVDTASTLGATNAAPDPPNLTPAAGSKPYLFVAGASYPTTAVSAYSSGYSNGIEAATTGTTLLRIASAENSVTGISDNPGTLTIGSAVKNNAYTYAVS
ncbi:hypothetical protein NKH75_07165 [Mesorhizobium sp. M0984]|uniref:hypothetical protein n=1 Tax=Mesorhizobium sp. M0984 TaxID=2957041 RepID=UPI0033356E3B